MRIEKVSLPGELWVLTTYFNPMGLEIRKRNYQIFAAAIKRQGARLATIENTAEGGRPDLDESQADRYFLIRGGDILWQKERLMNLLLAKIPGTADKIVYCDCDIIFSDDNWHFKTAAMLESYRCIQPFSHYIRLEKGCLVPRKKLQTTCFSGEEMLHSFALGFNSYKTGELPHHIIGSPGFSWAFRRSVLQECPLYENMIIGGGDSGFAYAASCSREKIPLLNALPRGLRKDYFDWSGKVQNVVRMSLGVQPGLIYHLWHGDSVNRHYVDRHKILFDSDFDPVPDLRKEPDGPLYWASDKPGLHNGIVEYFHSRQEEG